MAPFKKDPLWFKDAVIYQTHVKSFCDSDGDGIGDFQGLISKLDYLESIGITAIWILPFYPSPLRDDGYDIADYYDVNPSYGSLADFKEFLKAAHKRGIRVITELVLNHTSDQNEWFRKSRHAKPGDPWRDFYVWSDTPRKYQDARIIFKDFEHSNWSWDPVAGAYFWHRFYSHQPDLNFENPQVHNELLKTIDFRLAMGVDGLRLDAVPYLYEEEGTNCENLPKTHAFLQKLRAHIDSKHEDKMLLAEANQWPVDAVEYFGEGDKCQMAFHFPLMPRMFMAIQMEDRFPIIDILDQTPAIPENCQWATFLRNHDELTLEMVTDEERDYMYRMYASDTRARINLGIRRRLAPLLQNNRRKIELINALLFSLPGTPIVYYGDEIGMGDNIYLGDRNGCRTPMQWSSDRNAGFSRANPQQLYLPITIDPEYHYEAINVENQEKNLSALLWWMRRVIAMRKRFQAFGRGTIEFLVADNPKVLAFIRRFEDEIILVVVNLSRFVQFVQFDLQQYAGMRPVEIFSQTEFPALSDQEPFSLSLGRHDYYWLQLQSAAAATDFRKEYEAPAFERKLDLTSLLSGDDQDLLEKEILPAYVTSCRWFGGKARGLRGIRILSQGTLGKGADAARLVTLATEYADSTTDTYLLALKSATAAEAGRIVQDTPQAIIARFKTEREERVLVDAISDADFRAELLHTITAERTQKIGEGELHGVRGSALKTVLKKNAPALPSHVLKVEQSNSSMIYGGKLFLKLYRKLEEGPNPDAEITRFLTERRKFPHVPPFAGALEYHRHNREPQVLGMMQTLVANEGDAWKFTLDAVERFFERVLRDQPDVSQLPVPSLFEASVPAGYDTVLDLVGGVYPERARQLGQRTAEMHRALAGDANDPQFSPEAFTTLYQRSMYQAMRGSLRRQMQQLQKQKPKLSGSEAELMTGLLGREKDILARYDRLTAHKFEAVKTRIHGDYHLGQVLNTGRDFMIIDFEGEPSRPLSERKLKRSPLRDVAGMLRSFQYAPFSSLSQNPNWTPEQERFLRPWAERWAAHISWIFLHAYLEEAKGENFIPNTDDDFRVLLEAFILDKAIYEVGYEMNNRPTWISIPVRGILQILEG